MQISKKLKLIVALTILEISITVFSALEIAKGAKFHQLNFLHLKHYTHFSELLLSIENGRPIVTHEIKSAILNIKQQPIECIEQINILNKIVMRAINTIDALDICIKDIKDADSALTSLSKFNDNEVNKTQLLADLTYALKAFKTNSDDFESPINKTVSFLLTTLIPLVILISIFNIIFITYLSRTISSSIKDLTTILWSKPEDNLNLEDSLEKHTSSELKELMTAARNRIKKELFNLENSKELQAIVNEKTISLRKANEELSQFAYRTSHDLKSPLSSAKALAQFISLDIDQGDLLEAKSNANKISQQMTKLETLVVDILLLAQADIGSNKQLPIDFDAMVVDMTERLSWLRKDNPCSIDINISLSRVISSEQIRFSQIIENLISNSLKYYDESKASPYVKLDIFDNDESIFINISDNGIGIPQEYQREVFSMFKRFHPNKSNGSGLGMAIVKKHIDYLNGTITFESSSQGTLFKIIIPMTT
jgi:signal transduction histidine kinase